MPLEKPEIPVEAGPYTKALKALFDHGASATLLNDSILLDMDVVIARAHKGASSADRARAFIEVVEETIEAGIELKGDDQEAARIILAFDKWAGKPASVRRDAVAKLRDPHGSWANTYRKKPYDRDIYKIYLALYQAGARMVSSDEPKGQSNVHAQPSAHELLTGGDYIVKTYEAILNLPSVPGAPYQEIFVREIVALHDGVAVWTGSTRTRDAELDKGQSTFETLIHGHGTLSVTYDRVRASEGGREHFLEVRFSKPLDTDQRACFTIHRMHPADFEAVVRKGRISQYGIPPLRTQVQEATIAVCFPRDFRPVSVWQYENLPDILVPGVATDANSLTINQAGLAIFTWPKLLKGYCYGIAWRW